MRWRSCLAMGMALSLPAIVAAQQVTVAGWVDSVNMADSTITIRTLANPRTIQVAPNAVVQLNGVAVRLDQLPKNSQISIVTEKDSNGVLRATQLSSRATGVQPSAAVQPGALVRGTLVGMNIPNNTITIRTNSGDYPIALSTAPIIMNGIRASTRNLRIGQYVQVERTLPTAASTDYVTHAVRILPAAKTTTARGSATVKSKTAGSRTHYRSQSTFKKSGKTKQARARSKQQVLATTVWKGQRFTPVITINPEPTTAVVTGGTAVVAPATGVVTGTVTPGTAVVPGAVATPGTVAVPGAVVVPEGVVTTPGTAVVPGAVVTTPGTAVVPGSAPITATTPGTTATGTTATTGTVPQTNAAATGGAGFVDQGTALNAPATAPGTANARAQSLATPGAAATAVADPRFQAPAGAGVAPPGVVTPANPNLVTPGAILPGAATAPGVVDPRFQGIVTPGAVLPGAAPPPAGVPNPRFQSPFPQGFIGPFIPAPLVPGRLPLAPGAVRPGMLRPPVATPATGGTTGR
jgi:hypothetical protein